MNIIATSEITPAIRKWKPYPAYKHSGVEWLGTIPEHWNVSTLKLLAPTVQRGKSPDYVEEGGIPVINQACVYWEGLRLENIKYDSGKDGNDGKGRLLPGDVLVNSTGTGTLGRASVFRHEETHLADGHVTVVRIDQTAELPEYFFYLLQTPIYQGFIYAALVSGSTNQIELSRESFRATPTIVPPINEQARIARFLDQETAKIDALVAKKERLIELLQEKRAALITRAVTKGLDPNVSMKDSRVEWLGEIPAHWEVKRIKQLANILRGKFSHRPRNDPTLYDGSYPFIQTGDIASANKHLREYQQTLNESGYAVSKEFPEGTLVMAIAANIGDLAILGFRACFPDSIVGFVPKPGVNLEYLFYNLTAMRPEMLRAATLNTQMNLNIDRIGSLFTVQSPEIDQHAVVGLINRETVEIDGLVAKIREGIDKLKEYRTALISAAVTGKIDVRDENSL